MASMGALNGTKRGPSLQLDFLSASLDPRISFTRASTATYFNSAGTLTSAAINEARFDYNPSTLEARGLLIEEARTNSIRNNTMVGAVAGTPGTLPTNWSTNIGGLTREIVGTGTQNGVTYIDIRLSGTTTATSGSITFEPATGVSATNGQSWAESAYLALIAGSIANITAISLNADQRDSGGVFLASLSGADIKSNISASLTRFSQVHTTNNASIAFIQPFLRFAWANGAAIDITLRIGLPQLELGAFATSVIPTTTTALTRSADVASVDTLSPWYNASQGTWYVEYLERAFNASHQVTYASDGTSAERIVININSSNVLDGQIVSGGTDTFAGNTPTLTAQNYKIALAYEANNAGISANGSAVTTDTSVTLPVGISNLRIGSTVTNLQFVNSTISRIAYYPRRLSNAELVSITS
jgi:hypothetical protein